MLWTKKEKTQPIVLVEKTIQKIKKTLKRWLTQRIFRARIHLAFDKKLLKLSEQYNRMR